MTTRDTEIPPQHWNGDAKRNIKERVYSNRCYIWKQDIFDFFCFVLFLSNTHFSFTTKAYFWQLLTAFNIIHFIYKIVHNLFNKHCIKTRICTVKQPTTANRRGGKNSMFTFHFTSWLDWVFCPSLCFFGPRSKQPNYTKERKRSVQLWKVHPPVRVLEAVEFTADEVNFVKGHSHRLSVLWHARLDTWEEPSEGKTSPCFKVTVH